jgi:hypothetical protein
MHRNLLVPASAIAAVAGLLALCGCAPAATNASASGSEGTTPSASGHPAGRPALMSGGLVHLTGYSDNDGPKSTVILTGQIGDFGEAVRTYANGTTEQQYNQLNLAFTHGSFQLSIARLETDLVSAFGHFPTSTSTCSGIVTATAMTPIVAGSGTGAYQGISGDFTMTVTVAEVDAWPRCAVAGADVLLSEDIFLTGSGNVSFP